jgi:hypothetical protein
MTQIKDGGPAFPLQSIGPDFAPGYAGMTLRDYFAAQALHIAWSAYNEGYTGQTECVDQSIAHHAYMIADAMLKARGTQ